MYIVQALSCMQPVVCAPNVFLESTLSMRYNNSLYIILLSVCLHLSPTNNQPLDYILYIGPFPTDTLLKIVTTSTLTFCSIECIEVPECKSFAFLTTVNTANCYLASSNDGVATPTHAKVFKLRTYPKTIRVSIWRLCL